MASYLITYDLDKPGQDYSDILKTIKALGAWARLSESCYAVTSSLSPQQIYNKLNAFLDTNDQLYVISLRQPYWGRGPKEVNEWLQQNLDAA